MSKRKKFNLMEHTRRVTEIAAKDLLLHRVFGYQDDVEITNIKTSKPAQITRMLARSIAELPMKWLVVLYVFCKESNGKNKLIENVYRVSPRNENQLNDWLTDELQLMIESSSSSVMTSGWAAMPVPPAYKDEITEALLCLQIKSVVERPEYYEQEK